MRAALAVCVAAGCSTPLSPDTAAAKQQYPDLFHLYSGDQGIYRGCGPSGGVCHNSNEFPNLASIGSIADNIGRACNEKRTDPTTLDDLCERAGDRLVAGNASSEIAWIEVADLAMRTWRVELRDPIALTGAVSVERGDRTTYRFADLGISATTDPASDHAVLLAVPAPPPPPPDDDPAPDFGETLTRSGTPGDPATIQVGDPNRNGTFGADIGGAIIKPGDPTRSYLVSRLLDPAAGPLMPRANCCHWSRPAVRGLYCWIESLSPDGANALDPIDYERCSPGPSVELLYPEPGPACEQMGLCPAEAASNDDDPTFHNVYARVLVPGCAGSGCHGSGPIAGLDFTTEQHAFDTASTRVVPSNPNASKLYQRLDPMLCTAPGCATMPLGRPALPDDKLALVRAWIENGAQR